MKLDKKDFVVLEVLKRNSKLRIGKISKLTLIPITTVHNRIKKLEKLGVIKGYSVVLDFEKLEKPVLAFVLVTVTYLLPSGKKINQEAVQKEIKKLPDVENACIVTGATDIVIKVRARDFHELNDFVINKLRSIDGVDKTQTLVVLKA